MRAKHDQPTVAKPLQRIQQNYAEKEHYINMEFEVVGDAMNENGK
jgi:hypothetical protein